jgi:hypothetical protein
MLHLFLAAPRGVSASELLLYLMQITLHDEKIRGVVMASYSLWFAVGGLL